MDMIRPTPSLLTGWRKAAPLLVTILAFLSGCGDSRDIPPTPVVRPVKVLTVGKRGHDRTVRMSGEVRAARRADLAFRVPGQLIELAVREGKRVEKGQPIARIDPRDYEARLRKALGVLAKAQAKLAYDRAEYRRYLKIRQAEPGAVSASMLNLKKAAMQVSRAEVQAARATVSEAREQLAYTTLKAPFSGIVGRRYVDNFEYVTANRPVVLLQDFSRIEVLVDLPERMVAPIRRVEPKLFAEFPALPGRRFPLKIEEFATRADPLTQTYRAVLSTPAPEAVRILPGMTATVVIELPPGETRAPKPVIPAAALLADPEGRACVWVVAPDTRTVHRRIVETGKLTGTDRIEILSGLNPGDVVAVSGVTHLREGMKVRPYESDVGVQRP